MRLLRPFKELSIASCLAKVASSVSRADDHVRPSSYGPRSCWLFCVSLPATNTRIVPTTYKFAA